MASSSGERSSIPLSVKRMSMSSFPSPQATKASKRNSFIPRPVSTIGAVSIGTRRPPSAQSVTSGEEANVLTPLGTTSHWRIASNAASDESLSLAFDGSGTAEHHWDSVAEHKIQHDDTVRAPTHSSLNKRRGRSSISSIDLRSVPISTSSSTLGSVDDHLSRNDTNASSGTSSRIPRATVTVTHAASAAPSASITNHTNHTHHTQSTHSTHHSSGSSMTNSPVLASASSFGSSAGSVPTPTRRTTIDHYGRTDTLSSSSLERSASVTNGISRLHGDSSASSSPHSPYTPAAGHYTSPHTPSPYAQARRDLRPSPTGGAKTSTGRIIEGLQNEIETVKTQLDRANNEARTYRREIGALTRRNDELCDARDRMRTEADALNNVISRKERLISEAMGRAREAEAALAHHVEEREEVEAHAKRSIADATAMAEEAMIGKKRAVAEAEALRDSVQSLRDAWAREMQECRDEAARLAAQMQAEREEANRKRDQLVALVNSQAAEHQSVIALVQEVTSHHTSAAALFQQEITSLRVQMDQSAREADDARQLANNLAAELAHLRQKTGQPARADLDDFVAAVEEPERSLDSLAARSVPHHTVAPTPPPVTRGRPRAQSTLPPVNPVLYDDRCASARESMLLTTGDLSRALALPSAELAPSPEATPEPEYSPSPELEAEVPYTPATPTYQFPGFHFNAYGPESVPHSQSASPISPIFSDRPLSPDSVYDSEYEFEYDAVSMTIGSGSPRPSFEHLTVEGVAEKLGDGEFVDEVGDIEVELDLGRSESEFEARLGSESESECGSEVEDRPVDFSRRRSTSSTDTPAATRLRELDTELTPRDISFDGPQSAVNDMASMAAMLPIPPTPPPQRASLLLAASVPVPATPPVVAAALAATVPIPATPPVHAAPLDAASIPIRPTPPAAIATPPVRAATVDAASVPIPPTPPAATATLAAAVPIPETPPVLVASLAAAVPIPETPSTCVASLAAAVPIPDTPPLHLAPLAAAAAVPVPEIPPVPVASLAAAVPIPDTPPVHVASLAAAVPIPETPPFEPMSLTFSSHDEEAPEPVRSPRTPRSPPGVPAQMHALAAQVAAEAASAAQVLKAAVATPLPE